MQKIAKIIQKTKAPYMWWTRERKR